MRRAAGDIGTLISVFGFLVSAGLLLLAVRDHRAGASALWVGAGAVVFLSAGWTLAQEVRRARRERAGRRERAERPG
ncbi:hypothetical protein ACWD0J_30565 [Streptomyces sp. NPDC003011]